MDNHYNHFKKIDAHSHIGKFGSPFNIDFDLQRLTEQMEAYNNGCIFTPAKFSSRR